MNGTLSVFGFPSTTARLEVLPRSTGWRALRASLYLGAGLLLAPVLGLVPPHAPWAVAALGIGGIMGFRKWRERFTLLSLEGRCPRCGADLSVRRGTPLGQAMTVPCDECHFDVRLRPAVDSVDEPEVEAS